MPLTIKQKRPNQEKVHAISGKIFSPHLSIQQKIEQVANDILAAYELKGGINRFLKLADHDPKLFLKMLQEFTKPFLPLHHNNNHNSQQQPATVVLIDASNQNNDSPNRIQTLELSNNPFTTTDTEGFLPEGDPSAKIVEQENNGGLQNPHIPQSQNENVNLNRMLERAKEYIHRNKKKAKGGLLQNVSE